VPHGVAVEIMGGEKRADRDLFDIEATIYCEKPTHKGIIIGRGGEMLKRVGSEARRDLERLTGMAVNLNLWVKVKKDWRDSVSSARSLGGFNLEK
jgi:GTP-binding protein Era